jgi:hypothetical protein
MDAIESTTYKKTSNAEFSQAMLTTAAWHTIHQKLEASTSKYGT